MTAGSPQQSATVEQADAVGAQQTPAFDLAVQHCMSFAGAVEPVATQQTAIELTTQRSQVRPEP